MSACLALAPGAALRSPGRPSTFTPERGAMVCRALADGVGISRFRERDDLPDPMTVYRWLDGFPSFREAFTHARKVQAAVYIDRGVGGLEAVDPDSKFGSARVAKASKLFDAYAAIAGFLDREMWGAKIDVSGTLAVAIVTMPLSLLLPAAQVAVQGGADVDDPRVLELRALATANRAMLPTLPAPK